MARVLRVLAALVTVWMLFDGVTVTTKQVRAAGTGIPPIPVAPAGAPAALRDLVAPFPLVAGEDTDAASRQVLADYRSAHAFDAGGPVRMFTNAWHSLTLPPGSTAQGALATLERDLLDGLGFGLNPTPAQKEQLAADGAAILPLLARDPANGPRLNNAAVALYFLDFTSVLGAPPGPIDGTLLSTDHFSSGTRLDAHWLLQQAAPLFPSNHELAVNNTVFNTRLITAGDIAHIQADLTRLLAAQPGDTSTRLLLASYQLGSPSTSASRDRAAQTLAPLLTAPKTRPLGRAALGDIDLQLANDLSVSERFTALAWARQALHEYDSALSESTDPGLYHGRALALDFLGDVPAAIETERQAVERSPGSIAYVVELARLEAENGDIAGMKAGALEALARANRSWDPALADTDFPLDPCNPGSGTFLHTSFESSLEVLPLFGGCGGGGAYFVLNLIPKLDGHTSAPETGAASSEGSAIALVMSAALLTRDSALAADAQREAATVHPAVLQAVGDAEMLQGGLVPALHLLLHPTTDPHPENYDTVENAYRYAGLFRQAAAFCTVIASRKATTIDFDPKDALGCAGESFYLAAVHQDRSAQARLRDDRAAAIDLAGAGPSVVMPLEPAAAHEAAADDEAQLHLAGAAAADRQAARQIFLANDRPPQYPNGVDAVAWQSLGDLDLQLGHDRQAFDEYTVALSRVSTYIRQIGVQPGALVAAQVAYNNRGLVRLALLQPAPDEPPTCGQNTSACEAAQRDFEHARALDPDNPTFALNLGWVARLLKHEEDAKDFLRQAVTEDPTLYPAWNDLGVLAAEEGDTRTAREDWTRALQANPRYDLAEWNLGVLDMRQGVGGAFSAQTHFARAIERNPSLRSAEIEYRTDERVYRYVVGPDTSGGQALGRTLSIGTTALGWLTMLGLLFTVARSILTDKAAEKGAERVEERLPELREKALLWFRKHVLGQKEPAASPPEAEEAEEEEESTEGESTEKEPAGRSAWRRWEPWLITIPALVLVTAILAHRANPGAQLAVGILTLLATVIAIATHEAGHLLAARLVKARITQRYWTAGVPIALVLAFVPLEMNLGPYIGHEIEGEVKEHHAWRVFAAGPAANIVMAAICYGGFLLEPLPLLRLIAQAQLAVCAYSLLPVEQLDGKKLEKRPRAVFALGLVITAAGLAFLLGVL